MTTDTEIGWAKLSFQLFLKPLPETAKCSIWQCWLLPSAYSYFVNYKTKIFTVPLTSLQIQADKMGVWIDINTTEGKVEIVNLGAVAGISTTWLTEIDMNWLQQYSVEMEPSWIRIYCVI